MNADVVNLPAEPVIFGQHPEELTPAMYSFWGQSGWWTVPRGWYAQVDKDGQIWASPNSDFSKPKYAVYTNADGTMVFQDMMRSRYYHIA